MAPCSNRLSVHVTGMCRREWQIQWKVVAALRGCGGQGEQSLPIPVEGGVLQVTELCSFAVN